MIYARSLVTITTWETSSVRSKASRVRFHERLCLICMMEGPSSLLALYVSLLAT
jgi:hypothetical protein